MGKKVDSDKDLLEIKDIIIESNVKLHHLIDKRLNIIDSRLDVLEKRNKVCFVMLMVLILLNIIVEVC